MSEIKVQDPMRGQITDPKAALTYVKAGKSIFTLLSLNSYNRYTYKVTAAPKRNPNDKDTWFVKLLTGADNENSYRYLGIITANGEFIWTAKSCAKKDAPSVNGITFVMKSLVANSMVGFEFWHEDHCARCGKKLTVPSSIASGYGPDCEALVGAGALPHAFAQSAAVAVNGQKNLNFDGTVRQPKAKAAVAVAGTPVPVTPNVGALDSQIRIAIDVLKSENPEMYYQDGELDEQQAFNVAYNMFRVKFQQEVK